jgi:hypothetical protein
MRLLSSIETNVAVRSETDSRDPESFAGRISKRAEQPTRSAEESSTWSVIGRTSQANVRLPRSTLLQNVQI